jgi:hypothetical protein
MGLHSPRANSSQADKEQALLPPPSHGKMMKVSYPHLSIQQSPRTGSIDQNPIIKTLADANNSSNNTFEDDAEREQRLLYLRQAFCGFFKAKHTVEMQHLGRVICAILGLSLEEQDQIMESITKLSPAVVATTTLESFSQSIASIFS